MLLVGLNGTAHDFDSIAQKFTNKHRVIGITRRGFGLSSAPPPTEENYSPDRMADDDLAVMTALKIDRAVIAGHSIAGQELSSIATCHPERLPDWSTWTQATIMPFSTPRPTSMLRAGPAWTFSFPSCAVISPPCLMPIPPLPRH